MARGLLRAGLLGLAAGLLLLAAGHGLGGLARVPEVSASLPHLEAGARAAWVAGAPTVVFLGTFTGLLAFVDPLSDSLRRAFRRGALLALVPAAAALDLLSWIPVGLGPVVALCLAASLLTVAWCRPLARAPATAAAAALFVELAFRALAHGAAGSAASREVLGILSPLLLAFAAILAAAVLAFLAAPRPGTGRIA